ncbi:M20/M25/M40 family metallo-hydrolase [Bacillus sp. RO2]|uniref:M20/M25/M40 family metallo-hydrolase n=1 Tax=Bacillus sp. RO2 TaxID=2723913 RepID=UPI00145F9FD4|nr:M20/M25/M40 family metallo-hydrolase [Bacillus sp. RO2]NMH74347.1 M20/M25/M40 family metallo-hydrolase [Bacillus sp. RO2]
MRMLEETEQQALTIFKKLLTIDTTNGEKEERKAAEYLEEILLDEGIPVHFYENTSGRTNLVAKLVGGEEEPLYLISHLDVVRAEEAKWEQPPFSGVEVDGVIWGRGTLDTKQLTAMQVNAFLELARLKDSLNRDVYLLATADEENGSGEGMGFLKKAHPDLFQKGMVINEGGGFTVNYKGHTYLLYTAGEKGVAKVKVIARGQGGHASCPPENQAILTLAKAMERLLSWSFPKSSTKVSTKFKQVLGIDDISLVPKTEDEKLLVDLLEYMETTGPVVNKLEIGSVVNAIPYLTEVEVEFRLVPGTTKEQLSRWLAEALYGVEVDIEITSLEEGFECELDAPYIRKMEQALKDVGSNATLLPFLALGRTDGRYFGDTRSAIYGFSPLTEKDAFVSVLKKVHNHNENITRESFLFGTNVLSLLIKSICRK